MKLGLLSSLYHSTSEPMAQLSSVDWADNFNRIFLLSKAKLCEFLKVKNIQLNKIEFLSFWQKINLIEVELYLFFMKSLLNE